MTYVIEEPDHRHDEQAEAVESQGQEPGGLGVLHRVAGELLGLLEAETQQEEDEREDDADAEADAPDGAEMPVAAGNGSNV